MKYINILLILLSLTGCASLKIYHGFELSLPQNGKVRMVEETKPNFFVEWTVETSKLYNLPGYLLEESAGNKKLCLLFSGTYKKEIVGLFGIPMWTGEEKDIKEIGLYGYLLDKGQRCGRDLHWDCISDIGINKYRGRKAVSDKCSVMDVSLYVKQNDVLELLSPPDDKHHLAGVPLDIGEREVYLKLKVPDDWPKNPGYEIMFRALFKPTKFYRYMPLEGPDGEIM